MACKDCAKTIKDAEQIIINYKELMVRHAVLQDRVKELEGMLSVKTR